MSEIEIQPEDEAETNGRGRFDAAFKTRLIVELAAFVAAVIAVCIIGEVRKLQWWCQLRASLGSVEMQYNLAEAYAASDEQDDLEKAKVWFIKAAENGHAQAASRLSELVTDPDDQVKWTRIAAENGDSEAQYEMAQRCRAERVMQGAVDWYLKAAKQGNFLAQYNLGSCYRNGDGVEKNLQLAEEWYRKAADNGLELAKVALENLKE